MSDRELHIDVLRSVAILFMVEVHAAATITPTNVSATDPLGVFAAAIGGLAAPLFVTISGWGSQRALSRRIDAGASRDILLRWSGLRFGFLFACQLAVNLIAVHVFRWYTPGVLSLLALCALLAVPLARLGLSARVGLFAALSLTPFALSALFEMNGNWMDVVTAESGGEWFGLLLVDGTYPLLPWLAFFVLGGIIHDSDAKTLRSLLVFSFSVSAGALGGALLTNRAWALTSGEALLTFFPASSAFIISATCGVLVGVAVLQAVEESHLDAPWVDGFSQAGRISLTIYLLHFIPLRILHEMNLPSLSTAVAIGGVLAYALAWWPLAMLHRRFASGLSLEMLLRSIGDSHERDS